MSTTDNGGPAFPVGLGTQRDPLTSSTGLTLRDWFAGRVVSCIADAVSDPDEVARQSYEIADSMLAERTRGG